MQKLLLIAASFAVLLGVSFALSPVILVPGDGGSQLEGRGNKPSVVHFYCEKTFDWSSLWLNPASLLPGLIDCWSDNVKLEFDASTDTFANSTGVEIRVPGFGETSSVEYLSPSLQTSITAYMNTLVQTLVDAGLVRGTSIRAAPYDFRVSPRSNPQYFLNLQSLIEDTYTRNGNSPVVLLSHSMGCLMSLYFLNHQSQQWKDQYIKAWIPVSGVWGGTAKILRLLASGDAEGIPGVDPLNVRAQQRSYETNMWLWPTTTPAVWPADQTIVITDKRNYTASDVDAFFNDIGFPIGSHIRTLEANLTTSLTPPGVPTYCAYGSGVPTAEIFSYAPGSFPDVQPITGNGAGDGTVNARSLELCSQWSDAKVTEIPGAEHMGILSGEPLLALVKSVIGAQ